MEKGNLKLYETDIKESIKSYLAENETIKVSEWTNKNNEYDNLWFKPNRIAISDKDGNNIEMPVKNNSDFWITIEGEVKTKDASLTLGYAIFDENGDLLYWSYQTDDWNEQNKFTKKGFYKLYSQIPKRFLNEGIYRIELICSLHYRKWIFQPGFNAPFIYLSIKGGLSNSPYWMEKRPGLLAPVLKWYIENEKDE